VRLGGDEAWERVTASDHGVLGTVHPERGVDLVPVVYTVADHTIVIPVDTVKPKETTRLQRLENIAQDPRCTLLVDHYDDDWSRLWWVRVSGVGREASADAIWPVVRGRFPAYAEEASVATGIVLTPVEVTGWAASRG
jgi:PPOX class probable F420-dependent enzyme